MLFTYFRISLLSVDFWWNLSLPIRSVEIIVRRRKTLVSLPLRSFPFFYGCRFWSTALIKQTIAFYQTKKIQNCTYQASIFLQKKIKKQNKKLTYEFYNAMYIFYNKHYKKGYPWFKTAVTYMGIWGIYGLKMFKNYILR